jgi:hypothetical protein
METLGSSARIGRVRVALKSRSPRLLRGRCVTCSRFIRLGTDFCRKCGVKRFLEAPAGQMSWPPLPLWPFVPGCEIPGTRQYLTVCIILTAGVLQRGDA